MIYGTVTGNMGADAELRFSQSGTAILKLRVASRGRDNNDTQWLNVSLFGKRAEALGRLNLSKGTKVAASGRLSVREYDRRDGGKGSSFEMVADELELMGGGQRRDAEPTPNEGGDDIPF